jgi:hypothetical protein
MRCAKRRLALRRINHLSHVADTSVDAAITGYHAYPTQDRKFNGGCPGCEALDTRVRTSSIRRIAGLGSAKAGQRRSE